jgi:Isochorismatase family
LPWQATRIFDVPVVLTTVEFKSFSGNMWPQLKAVFPGQEPIERSSMNSWDDPKFVNAIERTGKKKIVLCGLWTETCVPLPTIQAIHDAYEVYVAEDCCGDVSQLAHDNAMRRVIQAGAKPVTSLSTLLEWQDEEIKQLESVLTIVGGNPVYGAEEFSELAPPAPPVLPEWSPVAVFGGYAKPTGAPVTAHSRFHHHRCTDHAFSGGLGCLCWAF